MPLTTLRDIKCSGRRPWWFGCGWLHADFRSPSRIPLQEALRGVKEHHNELYTQLKAKNTELGLSKDEEEKWRAQMDAAKAKEDEKKSDLPALFKERDELRKEMNAIRDEVRKIRDDFNEQRKEFFAYSKALREQKQKEWEARNAARDAEREAWRKAKEEEEAQRDPWEEEKHLCEQLISYVEKHLPKKETVAEVKKELSAQDVPKGAKIVKRDDDDDYLTALRSKKGKKKGAGPGVAGGAPPKPKSVKLSHAVEALSSFAKLGFSAPPSTEDCPALYEELLAKREWLKTAPPKEKKKPAAPTAGAPADPPKKEKDAPPTTDTALEIEGMTSQADADKIEAAIKALDGIISVTLDLGKKSAKMVGSPGFPTSDKMIEAVVAAGFKATEKRLAGGMFKFDPDEVDVNGGDATADDLMDAFGFGDMGEVGGDAEEEAEAEGEAAAEEVETPAPAPAPAPAKKDKDPLPTTDTALEIEGMASQADADKIEAAIKALDGIISVTLDLGKKSAKMVGSPGFPTSDKMIQAVVDAGFKATEKRLAGGMFKFDPDEVDVNGGDATADDLMDAFGFGDMGEGGDDPEEEEAVADEEAPALASAPTPAPAVAAAASNGSFDLITIKATSETTVKVGLNLGGEAAPAAPPKKEKDAPPTTDTALEIEGMTSQADADKIEAAIKALDGIISVTMNLEKKSAKMVGSPGFPTSEKMIEAVVAAGYKATEKRLAGGMFKFDPDEVDVNGGTATADDLMEAFGF
eukprot:scaffold153_cov105-Isochrysis_galbana.AAC.6